MFKPNSAKELVEYVGEKARKDFERTEKTSKPGSGARFSALTKAIAARGGVSDPEAVAASIGRKKYGKTKMAKMSARGRAESLGQELSDRLRAQGLIE